jgi:hypothetical protein
MSDGCRARALLARARAEGRRRSPSWSSSPLASAGCRDVTAMPRRGPMTVVVTADLVDELAFQLASERATAFRIAGATAAAELARQVAGELARQVAGELARQVAGKPRRGDDRREGLRCASSTTRTAPRSRTAELELDPAGRRSRRGRGRRCCRGPRSRARRSRQSKGRGEPTI